MNPEIKRGVGARLMMWGITGVSLLCLCAVPSFQVKAQDNANEVKKVGLSDYVEVIYDESDGMVASEANTVLQDEQGYLWVGSYGGLSRFNGTEFENISLSREGAPQTGIRILYQDTAGRVWIGTNDAGVYIYQDETFYQIVESGENTSMDVSKLSVREVVEGRDGRIYLGTTDGLFISEDARTLTQYADPALLGKTIENLLCDKNGCIWGTTGESQAFVLKDGVLEEILERDFFGIDLWNGLVQGSDGSIYFGTALNSVIKVIMQEAGVYKVSSLKKEVLSTGDRTTVDDIFQDSQGKIWICTENGTGYFSGEEDTFYEVHGLSGEHIMTSMNEDYEGNLWFASTRKGLIELARSKFRNIGYEANISGKTVNATVPYDGFLYIGTDVGLAVTNEAGAGQQNTLTELLEGIRVRHLMVDSQNNLWVSTYETYGAVCYNADTDQWISYTTQQGLPHDQIRMIQELSNHDIAIATCGGVAILREGEVIDTFTAAEGIQNEFILCLAETGDGKLLAGSDGNGIYEIDLATRQVRNIGTEQGLRSGVILRMIPDEKAEGIWVSNGAELSLLKNDEIIMIPAVPAGIGSIFDIKVAGDDIWLLKAFGMIRISRKALLAGSEEFETITRKDGLISSITANSWSHMGENGDVYLCTGDGVYYINIQDAYQNSIAPKIAVASILVDDALYYGAKDIVIPVDGRRISFELDLLSYGFSEGTLEYCLEGFDKEPIEVDSRTERQVTYTNLPGGSYTFHLIGRNSDGAESPELTFHIKKEKSFMEGSYFYVAVAALVFACILLGIVVYQYLHRKRILKRQKEYRNLTEQTIKIIAKTIDAKDKYTNGHSSRVAVYAAEIGRRYGLTDSQLEQLYYSALLHDIGKIGIPDSILKKADKLTEEEYEMIMQHPTIGGEILKDFTLVPWISAGAKYHHERYDGKGYNEGLKGEEIPLYARIISVADSYDCMNSSRVYRPPMPREDILKELENGRGTQFDKVFADIMIQMIRDGFTAE